jgi:hypothetical protein
VLNNVRYASDSDHSRYESELTLWANNGHRRVSASCPLYLLRKQTSASESRHQPPNLTIYGGLASETTRNGQREPKIVRQHAECHRDDENCYWQR